MVKNKGFTLIELLITVSIIAILSVIGLVAYSSFMKTARNSKRQSDLKLIQSALEDYHADQLSYPPAAPPPAPLGTSIKSGTTKTYLNTVPTDPKDKTAYGYQITSNGYCLAANMEGTNYPPSECTLPNYNYGVTRP